MDTTAVRPLPRAQVVSELDIHGLQTACQLVDSAHAQDDKRPNFWDLVEVSSSTQSDDHDTEPKFVMGDPIPLPTPLVEQFNYVNYKCFMGLFPEINWAWVTRDNHIFLWNYNDGLGSDFVSYDDLDQIIISAGLCRPRPGVFRDEIQWLLVLATPVDIVIVGMSFESGSIFGELTLVPTPLTIPSDNVNIISIQGTTNGRIFLTGRDGNLYELEYQEQDGWFTRKCRKLNHSQSPLVPYVPSFLRLWKSLPIVDVAIDHSRNILYTLSAPVDAGLTAGSSASTRRGRTASAVITVWDLGEDCTEMRRVVTYSSVLADARTKNRTLGRDDNIVSIHAIPVTEFSDVHLLAVTRRGIRIYMTTFFWRGRRPEPSLRPRTLQVVQVRTPPSLNSLGSHPGQSLVPPPYAASPFRGADSAGPSAGTDSYYGRAPGPPGAGAAGSLALDAVHTSYYSHGVYLMADAQSTEADRVVGIVDAWRKVDPRLRYSRLGFTNSEKSSVVGVEGKTWAAREVPMSIMIQLDKISELAPSYAYLTQDASKAMAEEPRSSASTTVAARRRKRRIETSARPGAAAASASSASVSASASASAAAASSRSEGGLGSLFWALFGRSPSMPTTYVPLQSRPNELATQHILPARKFLLLTNHGINVLIKLRPVDVLRRLLLESRDAGSDRLARFFEHYGADEACAMCLILATANPHEGVGGGSTLALRSMAKYMDAGSPTRGRTSHATSVWGAGASGGGIDANVVIYATSAFFKFGGFAALPDDAAGTGVATAGGSDLGYAVVPPSISYSGAHDGLYLYFARLVKPVWEHPLTYQGSSNSNAQVLQLERAQYEELESVLSALKLFLVHEPRFASLGDPDAFVRRSMRARGVSTEIRNLQMEAQKYERASLLHFQAVLNRTIEAVAFLKILLKYNFASLTLAIPTALAARLVRLTFADLVSTDEGDGVARALVMELMKMVSGDDTTDEISRVMHNQCPSFFSYGDMLRYKGFEALYRAEQAPSARTRTALLTDSLKHFVQTAATVDALASITDRYRFLRFYSGVLDLALARAAAIDPDEAALQWVLSGTTEPLDASPVAPLVAARFDAYAAILDTLGELIRPPPPVNPALGLAPRPDIDPADLDRARAQFVQRAVASRDELFHIELYRWYIREGLTNELLSISSPFLEAFLLRHDEYVDMLWNYYVRNSKFRQAATILAKLAEKLVRPPAPPLALHDRIQYLVQAIKCASAEASDYVDGEFLHELEEKLEVAQLQSGVLAELQAKHGSRHPPGLDAAVDALSSSLLNISVLYNDFAEPYGLHSSCLAIMHTASGLDDRERNARIESFWHAIIDDELPLNTAPHHVSRMADALARRVVTAGRKYHPPTAVFRLDFLSSALEARSVALNVDNFIWVVDALLEVGVKPEALFAIYDRHFDKRLPPWQAQEYQLHLLRVLAELVARGVVIEGRRVEDAVNKYKAALGAIPGEEAAALRAQF